MCTYIQSIAKKKQPRKEDSQVRWRRGHRRGSRIKIIRKKKIEKTTRGLIKFFFFIFNSVVCTHSLVWWICEIEKYNKKDCRLQKTIKKISYHFENVMKNVDLHKI